MRRRSGVCAGSIRKIKDFLENSANATAVITGAVTLLGALFGAFGISRLAFRKTRRLAKNLGRMFALIPSATDDMSQQMRLLKGTGFFKDPDIMNPRHNNAHNITDEHRLVIMRFSIDELFWITYVVLQATRLPIIIYATFGEIDNRTEMPRIQEYPFNSVCNTPVRLLSDVWAIMATWPEAKQ
jgi:hypothetical protein